MSAVALDRMRTALENRGSRFEGNKGSSFVAQCPAHEDGRPSLHVTDGHDRIVVHCFAGCNNDDIMDALGLRLTDLFDEDLTERGRDSGFKGEVVRSYVYNKVNGDPWIIKDRYYPKDFRLRLPGTQPGDYKGIGDRVPILYRADKIYQAVQAGKESGEPVVLWLVDGEKDVERLEREKVLATCTVQSAGAGWRESYSQFLRGVDEVRIIVDQDPRKKDGSLGAGQTYAQDARAGLRSVGVKVVMLRPAVGKDITDHLAAGMTLDNLEPEPTAYTRPRGKKADDLMLEEFEPVKYAVEGLLPTGLTIFAGSPKSGKSWTMLDICLAVAAGGPALSSLVTTQGSVLYLAREDTYRRLQGRMNLVMGGFSEAPPKLELVPDEVTWVGGEQGIANMTEWAEECGDPTLVVLDTLAKVEPEMGEGARNTNAYGANYSMMSRYKNWADDHNCAVVMVHHDRKGAPSSKNGDTTSDPFSKISGTRGLTGAADTMWFLEAERGTRDGTLHVTGRDVIEQSLPMSKVGPLWCVNEPVETV